MLFKWIHAIELSFWGRAVSMIVRALTKTSLLHSLSLQNTHTHSLTLPAHNFNCVRCNAKKINCNVIPLLAFSCIQQCWDQTAAQDIPIWLERAIVVNVEKKWNLEEEKKKLCVTCSKSPPPPQFYLFFVKGNWRQIVSKRELFLFAKEYAPQSEEMTTVKRWENKRQLSRYFIHNAALFIAIIIIWRMAKKSRESDNFCVCIACTCTNCELPTKWIWARIRGCAVNIVDHIVSKGFFAAFLRFMRMTSFTP